MNTTATRMQQEDIQSAVNFESDALYNMDAIDKDLADENSTIRKFMQDYKVDQRGYIVPRKNKNPKVNEQI